MDVWNNIKLINEFDFMLQRLLTILIVSVFSLPIFASIIPSAPEMPAKSFILLDHDTGKVLAEKNADYVVCIK